MEISPSRDPGALGYDASMSDQPPTNHTDHDKEIPDQPPTTPDMVPLKEAAEILGISVNAVRQRLKRGTLQGVKTPAGWVVSPTTDRPPTTAGNQTPTTPAATDQPPTDHVDLSQLVELVDTLRKENAQLSGAAAWLLSQNAQLQRELQDLRTIEATASEGQNRPESDETGAHGAGVDHGGGALLRRIWRLFRS